MAPPGMTPDWMHPGQGRASECGVSPLSEQEHRAGDADFLLIEALASSFGAAVVVFDGNDILVHGSPHFTRFYPVSPEILKPGARLRDFLGAVFDCIQPLDARSGAQSQATRDDWIADRVALHWRERFETVEQLPDGRWVKLAKRRLPGGWLITSVVDVSEQKRRDRDLSDMRDQAELSQHILDNLANPVIVKDAQLRYVIVNDAVCQLLGMSSRSILGRRASELVSPEAAKAFEDSERAVLKTGVPIEFVEDIPRPDGTFLRSITRKRRSGSAGNYYVTISIDHITTYSGDQGQVTATDGGRFGRPPIARVLVVDENRTRAGARAAELTAAGNEAMAVSEPSEAFVFLDTARAMGLTIDRVEPSPTMAEMLARYPLARTYPCLARALPGEPDCPAQGAPAPLAVKSTPAPQPPAPQASVPKAPISAPVAAAPEQTAAPAPSSVSKKRRIRVLVAEDNDVNQIVFAQILEGLGVDFHIAADGEQAVAAWTTFSPDIILMDVSMPVMNGLEASAAIRAAENGASHVPIVAVTAHAMGGDRERCLAAGMDDYLTKPVSPDRLETVIRAWVRGENFEISAA